MPGHEEYAIGAIASGGVRVLNREVVEALHIPNEVVEQVIAREQPELERRERERAIGVIYRPDTERSSHYFYARLPQQFDAVVHFDRSRAVEPLERKAERERGELPETYPVGV